MSANSLHHNAHGRRYDALVLDLDNTLYDWVHYYAGSLRAVIEELAGALGLEEEELLRQFRDVFASRGSLEYAFIVQELDATKGLNPGTVEELIDLAQRTFAEARRRLLHPYEGAADTLDAARAAGVVVIAVTNAPFFQAHRRLRQLGLLDHFDALGAWEGFAVPERDPYLRDIRGRLDRGEYESQVQTHRVFGKRSLKPGDTMFRWALEVAATQPERALAVGDSVAKDVAPAMSLGASGAWSAYGAKPDGNDFELLLKVTPWRKSEIAETYAANSTSSYFTLDRFSDLVEVIGLDASLPARNNNSLRSHN